MNNTVLVKKKDIEEFNKTVKRFYVTAACVSSAENVDGMLKFTILGINGNVSSFMYSGAVRKGIFVKKVYPTFL